MTMSRRILSTTLAGVLALSLAACDSAEEGGDVLNGDPIAAIAAPDGTEWTEKVTITDSDGYVLGNPEAPIKVIEYASLTCGACANFAMTGVEPLKEKYVNSGVVSYELRNQIHNGIDLVLARLVRCSAPESYHPLSEQVWANLGEIMQGAQTNQQGLEAAMNLPEDQRYAGVAEAAGFLDFFAARGISSDQARTCLADTNAVQAIATRSAEQSEELDVTGTPTFFINGRNVGTQNWASLEPMLQKAGAR